MKFGILVLAFATAPAWAIAAETPVGADGVPCALPRIPAVSTSQPGANRVKKSLKEWDACVATNPGTDPILVTAVSAQAHNWLEATTAYSRGQRNSRLVAQRHERTQKDYVRDIVNARKASAQGLTR